MKKRSRRLFQVENSIFLSITSDTQEERISLERSFANQIDLESIHPHELIFLSITTMRPLTDDETKILFEKLAK